MAATTKDTKVTEPTITDPWLEEVDMYIPKAPKGENKTEFVSINGRIFNVPRNGTMQKLPRPVADILDMAYKQREEADRFGESMPKEFGDQRA